MPGDTAGKGSEERAVAKPATLGKVVKTVLFAFFGVRKRAAHDEQTVRLTPVQIIVAGIFGGTVFVVSLVMLAKFVVGRAMG